MSILKLRFIRRFLKVNIIHLKTFLNKKYTYMKKKNRINVFDFRLREINNFMRELM